MSGMDKHVRNNLDSLTAVFFQESLANEERQQGNNRLSTKCNRNQMLVEVDWPQPVGVDHRPYKRSQRSPSSRAGV